MRSRCLKMRYKIAIVTVVLLAAACTESTINLPEQMCFNIKGKYRLTSNATTMFEVKREEAHFIVLLSGGSLEAAGAAAGADCYIRAIGNLQDNSLVESFAAIETDTIMYSKTQAQEEKRRLEIKFDSDTDTAEVIHADTFGYCGLGVTFLGLYQRKDTSKDPNS